MKNLSLPIVIASGLLLSFAAIATGSSNQDVKKLKDMANKDKLGSMGDVALGIIPAEKPDNTWLCEPIFIYDCTGITPNGRTHMNLSVYNNGLVNLAQFNGEGSSRNMSKLIKPNEARRFYENMSNLGAWTLTDQKEPLRGHPMRSITILEGTSDSKAHSFNYFDTDKQTEALDVAVRNFVRNNFADAN